MYARQHPWFTAAAGLSLALGLATAMDTSAPALRLASDAVVMPSAAPLPETPVEPASNELPAPPTGANVSSADDHASSAEANASSADGNASSAEDNTSSAQADAPSAELPAASDPPAPGPEEPEPAAPALTDEAEEESPYGAFEVPEGFAGPPEPAGTDLDCVDFEDTPFRIDPNNDPHGLDADSDGLACEPPPSD